MMRDSAPPLGERPGLEDVAEEEDVFAGVENSKSPQAPTQTPMKEVEEEDKEGQLAVSQMEAEFVQLTFRKQVSYRKAIAKSGLHHLPCQPGTSSLTRTDPEANIRSTVDWSESALYGDHIWFETNVSGDYCYVGEQHCIARIMQKSVSRRKCAACKIVAHTICIEQLEKINFRCKPSFRDSGSRNIREPIVVRHHWVHRRRQEGKCKQCGKGFQQKFAFHSKEIVAISCSWCKQAYHNKVSCFMLQQIEEACQMGAHAALIVPPTWIIRVRRHQSSMKSSKKKKRTSFKRKSSKKGAEEGRQWKPFIIRPIPSPLMKPLLVFVNPKSGGNQVFTQIQSEDKTLQAESSSLNPGQLHRGRSGQQNS